MRKLFLCFFICFSLSALCQTNRVNISEFMKDLTATTTSGRHVQVVLWFPTQYWQIMGNNMKLDQQVINDLQERMNNYIIIALADGQVMDGGFVHFSLKTDVAASLFVVDSAGKQYRPEDETDLPDKVLSVASALKPVFSNLLGALGEGTNLYFFKLKNPNDQNLVDAEKRGKFTVSFNGINNTYNLPLPSLLPPKFCPVDNARMNGNWNYCPIHGNKL